MAQQEQIDANVSATEVDDAIRSQLNPEDVARHARKRFGDRLPEGALRGNEYKIYERLFGTPLTWKSEHEQSVGAEDAVSGDAKILLKETADGSLEEVEYNRRAANEDEDGDIAAEQGSDYDPLIASLEGLDPELQDDIRAALAEEDVESPEREEEDVAEDLEGEEINVIHPTGLPTLRTHPFTLVNRSGTDPTTIQIPKVSITTPTASLLAESSNQHLRETAERLFGGPGLPYSTGTPRVSRTKPQKPIPLSAFQSRMTPLEANVYLAALMPGMYSSVTHVLVESRRNLGAGWLQSLLQKEDGPSILDAGAGGAGVLAWREILKAEHARLRESMPELKLPKEPPLGKSTVLTSSSALRQRASALLGNTTFLPRLPDYVHTSSRTTADTIHASEKGLPHGRKQFDVIVAPHSLWPLQEEWQRRQHIQNLWAMLNLEGGVLILLEKGVPRGFEVLASARQYLLDDLFISEEDTSTAGITDPGANTEAADQYQVKQNRQHHRHAAPGAIIAPCTTHAKCPMYRIPGISRQRKDYCRFAQRYIRPAYQQSILGAKSRNHEDVEFSYVSVIKGRTAQSLGRVGSGTASVLPQEIDNEQLGGRPRLMGKEASDRAYRGYEVGDADLVVDGTDPSMETPVTATPSSSSPDKDYAFGDESNDESVLTTPPPPTPAPHRLTLPRLILPPLKRPRHVHLDVCTSAGTLERWSVPRSYSRQAYRDARKSAWGDLWALGAKAREGRRVRLGVRGGVVDGRGDQGMDEEANAAAKKAQGGQGRRRLTGRLKARSRKRSERALMEEKANSGRKDPDEEEDNE